MSSSDCSDTSTEYSTDSDTFTEYSTDSDTSSEYSTDSDKTSESMPSLIDSSDDEGEEKYHYKPVPVSSSENSESGSDSDVSDTESNRVKLKKYGTFEDNYKLNGDNYKLNEDDFKLLANPEKLILNEKNSLSDWESMSSISGESDFEKVDKPEQIESMIEELYSCKYCEYNTSSRDEIKEHISKCREAHLNQIIKS